MGGFGTTWGFLERTGDSNRRRVRELEPRRDEGPLRLDQRGKDGRLASGTGGPLHGPLQQQDGRDGDAGERRVRPERRPSITGRSPRTTSTSPSIGATMQGSNGMYYNPYGEVYVIPSGGGTATRLAANDPVSCLRYDEPRRHQQLAEVVA